MRGKKPRGFLFTVLKTKWFLWPPWKRRNLEMDEIIDW